MFLNFARDKLRSYLNEPQNKMKFIFLLYIFYSRSTHYFRAFCVKFINYTVKKCQCMKINFEATAIVPCIYTAELLHNRFDKMS